MKRILMLAVAGSAFALPAFAGNVVYEAPEEPVVAAPVPAPAPIYDWSGPYVGAQIGYGFGEFSNDIDDFDSDGIIYGLHAGYLSDLGTWVIGGEIQADATELDIDTDEGSGSFDQIARLKLKAGYDLGQTLLYGTAGIAYANFDGDDGAFDVNLDDNGYVLGVGADYKITENWIGGLEYQYHMFNDFGEDGNDVDVQTIHARVSYQF